MREVSFIGIPSFPIAVERAVYKRLRGRPAAVVQSESSRSQCLAVSQEAREMGVSTGMRLFEARRACRDLTVLHPNPSLYSRAKAAIVKILSEYSPLCEPSYSGQFYIDLTGSNRLFGGAFNATQTISSRIAKELRLPVDAGISQNKLVSRVAAIDANPEGVLEVERGGEEHFLAPHCVTVLPAAKKQVRIRLSDLNIQYVQQLKEMDFDVLFTAIGSPTLRLRQQARGVDPTPVTPPNSSPNVFVSETPEEDTNNPKILEFLTRELLTEALFQLSEKGHSARALFLKLHYSDGRTSHNVRRLKGANVDDETWFKAVDELFGRTFTRRIRVKRIDLILFDLFRSFRQLDFLDSLESPSSSDKSVKKHRLDKTLAAVKNLQDKFGKQSVGLGMVS